VIYYHTVCLPECIRDDDVFEKDYVFGECLNSIPLYTKLQSGCDPSCRECTGSGFSYECTSCPAGFYLSKYANTDFSGECLPKTSGIPS
jgi:hypothetical protein